MIQNNSAESFCPVANRPDGCRPELGPMGQLFRGFNGRSLGNEPQPRSLPAATIMVLFPRCGSLFQVP